MGNFHVRLLRFIGKHFDLLDKIAVDFMSDALEGVSGVFLAIGVDCVDVGAPGLAEFHENAAPLFFAGGGY